MKKWIAVTLTFAAACIAVAQTTAQKSPAGEAPMNVRNGRARLVGHFGNPKQMLRLAIGLSHPHMAEEDEFVRELATPGSQNFRKFLTADEFTARFGPSAADEQAVVDWATGQGMTITHRFANRLIVDVEAPVATVERALQVSINNYLLDGNTYFSNDRDPVIPGNLSAVIHSIGGMHNFPEMRPAMFHGVDSPAPMYRPGPVVGKGQTSHSDSDGSKSPQGHSNSRENFTNGLIDPQNIYSSQAYNYAGLQNLGLCCNPFHAAGGAPKESSIALATFGNLRVDGSGHLTDIIGFQAQHPYLAVNVTTVPIDGGPGTCTVTSTQSCSGDGETSLDSEWSTATSNSFGSYLDTAQIWVYEDGGSAEDMYNAMLSDDHARTFSTSWSCTEISGCSASTMDTRHGIFNSMAAAGWTLMTASGDRGSTDDCSTVSVSYPASDPDVVGVGGTLLGLFNDGTFSSEVAWTGGTGAGSCSKNNGGSGGGCSVHFDNPIFSNGTTLSNGSCGTKRSVPDISLNAAAGQDYFFNGSLQGVGGTSISSPMLSGFFAQAEAYLLYIGGITGNNCGTTHLPCTPIGFGTPYIHYFGQNPDYAPHYPFYDITSGCNSNDITAGQVPNLTSFCAVTGYDSVTGWGTANMLQFAWAINSYFAGDFSAPAADFTGSPVIGHWYNTSQAVNFTLNDTSGNGAKAVGVAGYTQNWDADPGDDIRKNTPGTGSNYYAGPAVALGSSGSEPLNLGCHTLHVRAWDNGGSTADQPYGPVCFDNVPPVVNCGSPDGLWHANDVSIACTASDALSGLLNSADANFNLTTSVPANTETATAFTNSHSVSDVATNVTTKGPLGPNKVDKKPPSVSCGAADGLWHANNVNIPCTASDGGSGLANPADASFNLSTSVPANTETDTAATNSHAVPDAVGNVTTAGPVGGNMIDRKPPVITITQPAATTYTHSSTLTLNYTVTDGGSGVASDTPTMNGNPTAGGVSLANGTAITLLTHLPLGPNTFAISAVDKVGNASSASTVFTIVVTAQSMIDDVNQLVSSGAISGNPNSLLAKLNNALSQRNAGNCTPAGNMYGAFINEVNAQTGKSITAAAAAILIADAQYLIANCP